MVAPARHRTAWPSVCFVLAAALATGGCARGATTATAQQSSRTDELHALRGGVRGLDAVGLVLENGRDAIALSKDGYFVFPRPLAAGAKYAVTIAQQPDGETCNVLGGSGSLAPSDVTPVAVVCAPNAITVEGAVSGLRSRILVGNGSDLISVAGGGRFFMPTKLGPATPYDVVVERQPMNPRQVCTVEHGRGTTTDVDVTDIQIVCVDQ